MKRYCVFVIATIVGMLLVGCNKDLIDTNYTYDHAIIKIGDEVKTISIKQWTDYEDGEQIQIIAKDGTVYLVNSINCTLVNNP